MWFAQKGFGTISKTLGIIFALLRGFGWHFSWSYFPNSFLCSSLRSALLNLILGRERDAQPSLGPRPNAVDMRTKTGTVFPELQSFRPRGVLSTFAQECKWGNVSPECSATVAEAFGLDIWKANLHAWAKLWCIHLTFPLLSSFYQFDGH